MMFWLQKRWLKITDVIEDYWSWSNLAKLCAVLFVLWFLHGLAH